MTTCAMMGQAVGVAAAWSAAEKKTVRQLDYLQLRNHLEKRGNDLKLDK